MNNVCLAGQVAVLFRRLVHVVSTVSVAQQYHFYKRKRSTAEHPSSQPTIELQGLSLGRTLLSADRPSTIPSILAEQWSRLKDGNFGELWHSNSGPAQQRQRQPSFGACLLCALLIILLTLL